MPSARNRNQGASQREGTAARGWGPAVTGGGEGGGAIIGPRGVPGAVPSLGALARPSPRRILRRAGFDKVTRPHSVADVGPRPRVSPGPHGGAWRKAGGRRKSGRAPDGCETQQVGEIERGSLLHGFGR